MWDEKKFFEDFKKDNDNIKPSQDFKNRLSVMVAEESKSDKVIPFYRNKRVMGTVAATAAALVVLVTGVGMYQNGSIFNMGDSSYSQDKDDKKNKDKNKDDNKVNIGSGLVAGNTDEDDSKTGTSDKNFEFSAKTVDPKTVSNEIKDGAIVYKNGQELQINEAIEFAHQLMDANIIKEKTEENVLATYEIAGEKTWQAIEYENGEIYLGEK